jgi:hypothetical protein
LNLSRLDLDGAGSPEALVARILKLEPGLALPIPIEALCSSLDIIRIAELETEGFEAALITDDVKSQGAILLAKGRSRQRRRFSVAHELGHFLIPAHMPPPDGQFLCSAEQLRLLTQRDQDRRARMEVEANRFAALLLMPPPLLRARLREKRHPRLEQLVALADTFDVSKDAMARAYAEHHDEAVAVLIWRNGRLARCYRSATMPWLRVQIGDHAKGEQLGGLSAAAVGSITALSEDDPHHWFDARSARGVLELTEQRLSQRDGFVMQMVHAELRDEDEPGDHDPDERWRPRF